MGYPTMTKTRADRLIGLLFLGGIALRLALFWVNAPSNAFDDHFEPIFLIAQHWALPGKLDCWECYQPPVFYVLSAVVAKALGVAGLSNDQVMGALQFLNCLYGILTLWIVHLILGRLRLSDFSRVIAFGTVCFLPRHIYMGALHANDTLSYLTVAICLYLLLVVVQGKRGVIHLAALSAAICAAVFTKYTALAVMPVVAAGFALLMLPGQAVPRIETLKKALVVLLVPTLLLAGYLLENKRQYGAALPFNTAIFDPAAAQPRDPGGVSFLSFKPWQFIEKPILWPGQLGSFWTLMHSSAWFDSEPKFLPFLEAEEEAWWLAYNDWLAGRAPAPPEYTEGIRSIRWSGSLLVALGLLPLTLALVGLWQCLLRSVRAICARDWPSLVPLQMFVVLLLFNIAGVIRLAIGTPVYSAMKASYLLPSLPAFAVFLALGVMALEARSSFKIACGAFFAGLFLLVSFNTMAIVLAFP